MTTVYVYIMDTMADWECSHMMAELKSKRFFKKDAGNVELMTVSVTKGPVHSMGGLTIIPDCTADEVKVEKENMLILPGSDRWNRPEHLEILKKAQAFLSIGAGVAAICGATTALAGLGILDERTHTSNGAGFLNMFCPDYKGEKHYVDRPAVRDENLITAGATGGLLMAKLVLEYLDVFSEDTLKYWYSYFSTGNAEAFFSLMQTVQ